MSTNFKKTFFIFAVIFATTISLPYGVFAEETSGIISNSIWYSKTPLEEGDNVKIYTAIWNSRKEKLSGTVIFTDGDIVLGKKDFIALPESTKDVSIYWVVGAGEHEISAKIINTKTTDSKGSVQAVDLALNETPTQKYFIPKKNIVLPESESKGVDPNASSDQKTLFEKTDSFLTSAENAIVENTPDILKDTFASIESFRDKTALDLSLKKESFKAQTNSKPSQVEEKTSTNTESKSSSNDTKTTNTTDTKQIKESKETIGKASPMAYVGLFLTTLGTYIFTYGFLFYGILILLIFLILRFIYKKSFN